VPEHDARVLVARVDVVSGVGYDRAEALGSGVSRFHEIRRVITNLGVFDFNTSDHRMRLVSLHPGVELPRVLDNTGFELVIPERVDTTAVPPPDVMAALRRLDPRGEAQKEVVL
jgi:acyl CoA:acetate/3-ketoacid CoA transferase beta subunit